MKPVSIPAEVERLTEAWKPVDIAVAGEAIVRLARLEGEFEWHLHDEDELFLCWEGSFRIERRGEDPVTLGTGDLFVVARGVQHRPVAARPAYALLVEKPETKQYGS